MDEEEKKIRHTISAEETFTLAKDVFDIRTFIKNVYANRAIIRRRINIVSLCVGMIYTLLYASYVLYRAFGRTMSNAQQIWVYAFVGVYALVLIALLIIGIFSSRATTKNLKKYSLSLKIIRLVLKLLSIAMAISAIVMSASSGKSSVALDITIVILSIISLIVMTVPMFFGGIGKFVRWLLSPVKVKYRFSVVVMEWYGLATTGKDTKSAHTRVAKKHYEAIDRLIDGALIPVLGKRYINTIKPATLLDLVENCPEDDRPVLEGVLNSVFAYAAECGYVIFDPCRDLNFVGTVEEEKKRTFKERFAGIGAKLGKRVLDKYIASTSDDED